MRNLLLTLLLLPIGCLQAQWQPGMLDRGLDTMHYLVHFPEGYDRDTADWPVILFLHGGGNSGSDLQRVRESGLPKEIDNGRKVPAIIIAPQNRFVAGFWDHVTLTHLLDDFIAHHRVDEHRQYITGFSRGGFGAWMTAMHNNGRFAALAPVCGAVPHSYNVWIDPELPIWVFHGAQDQSIYLSESVDMLEILQRKMTVKPKFTVFENTAHNAWDPAYATDELYEWMLAQKKSL
ncbi:alpha/beta hydrolase-fold protein [Lewinella sp. 4G2]|uniref:carboxylesterase family protein n=1 Tax=Lewinella sp. 4G2 TaxID=1803372 RepID=UPI0007B46F4B|nr:alpha/beta hydrolase-fold protein [Lewinella sp. 4G2]OAV44825.1 hypothetical protein A3850_010135 [Lewinella sp. 4G2]